MSVKEVRERLRENVASIIGSTMLYTANIFGSDGFWLGQQGKLGSAVDQLSSLTVFTTSSTADHHWHVLHRLMPGFSRGRPA